MRIIDIMESENQEDLIKQIKESKWYKEGARFYRAVSYDKSGLHKVTISKDRVRKPRDVSTEIHDMINKLSFERFGYKVRNGLFLSQSTKSLEMYGKLHAIFPLDDTDLFISKGIRDFFDESFTVDDLEYYVSIMGRLEPTGEFIEEEIMGFGTFILVAVDDIHNYGLEDHTNDSKDSVIALINIPDDDRFLDTLKTFIGRFKYVPDKAIDRFIKLPERTILTNYLTILDTRLYTDIRVLSRIFNSTLLLTRFFMNSGFVDYIAKHKNKLDILLKYIGGLTSTADIEGRLKPLFHKTNRNTEIIDYMRKELPKYNEKAFEMFKTMDK